MDIKNQLKDVEIAIKEFGDKKYVKNCFQKLYPSAPEYFSEVATFHTRDKGIDTIFKWLKEYINFLQKPVGGFSFSQTHTLISHLYNLILIEELLDKGAPELLLSLENLKFYEQERDWRGIQSSIEVLENALGRFR